MQILSNELKAIAVLTDMSESGATVSRNQCMTVEKFQYHCERKRDRDGRTYGASDPVMLTFSVRLNAAGQAQLLYKQMTTDEHEVLSFLFNATFNDTNRLSGYDNAIAVDGYIVDIQEDFESATESDQTLLCARMQVRSIIYVGQNEKKTLCFLQ